MKNSTYKIVFASLLFSVVAYEAEACGEVAGISGTSCTDLSVQVDFTKCQGKVTPARILYCKPGAFEAYGRHGLNSVKVFAVGESWGGKTTWKVSKTEQTTEKEMKEKFSNLTPKIIKKKIDRRIANVDFMPATPTPQTAPAVADKKDEVVVPFTPKTDFFGDLQHRHEISVNDKPGSEKDDNFAVNRLRVRLGVRVRPVEELALDFRLATGTGGTSANQTYGDTGKGTRNHDFKLDRASFTYALMKGLHLQGGRMAIPFQNAGANDLIFDNDLNFEGSAIRGEVKVSKTKLFATAADTILEDSKDSTRKSDAGMLGLQVGARTEFSDLIEMMLVFSHYAYSGVKGHTSIIPGSFNGNSNENSDYTSDYGVSTAGLEFNIKSSVPVILYGEYVTNREATTGGSGYIAGVRVNRLKEAGDWVFALDHRELDRDATLGATTDGTSFGGGTNGRAWRTSFAYGINKAFNIQATYSKGEKNISPGENPVERTRLQLDLNFKF